MSQLVRLVKFDATVSVKDKAPASVRPIKKSDEELQIVWGEVYAPDFPDSQGDFATRETIRKMAYGFMQKGDMFAIDTGHSREKSGAYIVESFIARDDDATFIPGSWVLGVRVPDNEWALVKSGELNGFSMDGFGVRVETQLDIDMPDTVYGECIKAEDGHTHKFMVKYNDDGTFAGGETDAGPDGHRHKILRGTCTEVTNGHSHRFSFVEGIMEAQLA